MQQQPLYHQVSEVAAKTGHWAYQRSHHLWPLNTLQHDSLKQIERTILLDSLQGRDHGTKSTCSSSTITKKNNIYFKIFFNDVLLKILNPKKVLEGKGKLPYCFVIVICGNGRLQSLTLSCYSSQLARLTDLTPQKPQWLYYSVIKKLTKQLFYRSVFYTMLGYPFN